MPSPTRPDTSMLSRRARGATTSAIRDLLEHAQQPGMISLAGGLPDPAGFPVEELADIAAAAIRADDGRALQYGLTAGEEELRAHIVADTPAATDLDAVIITTGSQQALHLLAEVLLDPGDRVVVAEPEYLGAMQAFRSAGAALDAVPIDAHGLAVERLATRLDAGLRPKLVYTVPHFHNPSGATLSVERRDALLDLADHYGFVVVLDDPYRDLGADEQPTPELAAHPRLVQLRSTSKVLAPGLRVGWMIGPSWLTSAVERAKQAADLHTSTVSQAIVTAALQAPWYPDHLRALHATTRTKRDVLCNALNDRFGDRIRFDAPAGGMFVWAELVGTDRTDELLARALAHGVAFVPGAAFAVDGDLGRHLRLSWATASPAQLTEAVDRLAAAQ